VLITGFKFEQSIREPPMFSAECGMITAFHRRHYQPTNNNSLSLRVTDVQQTLKSVAL
jgi:hypothetical protein